MPIKNKNCGIEKYPSGNYDIGDAPASFQEYIARFARNNLSVTISARKIAELAVTANLAIYD